MIHESQRRAYLAAMDIDVWLLRPTGPGPDATSEGDRSLAEPFPGLPAGPGQRSVLSDGTAVAAEARVSRRGIPDLGSARFTITAGSGDTILLCESSDAALLPIATDIARCLPQAPVWGYLSDTETALDLAEVIRDRLLTRVLVLLGDPTDEQASQQAQEQALVQSIRGAEFIFAPRLAELACSPAAKRTLWQALCRQGWCRPAN